MKGLLHISKNNQMAALVLGFIIAIFSIVAPHYSTDSLSYERIEEVSSDQRTSENTEHDHSKDKPVKEKLVKAIDAVPNVLQISFPGIVSANIPDFSIELQEFLVEKAQVTVLSTSKHFKTLFRHIISPNAP